MAFLGKRKKQDMLKLDEELGINATLNMTVPCIKIAITNSGGFEEEFVKYLYETIIVNGKREELEGAEKMKLEELERAEKIRLVALVKEDRAIYCSQTGGTSRKLRLCKEIKWTTECQNAFRELREKLTDKPVLYAPNFEREFIVQTDALNSEDKCKNLELHVRNTSTFSFVETALSDKLHKLEESNLEEVDKLFNIEEKNKILQETFKITKKRLVEKENECASLTEKILIINALTESNDHPKTSLSTKEQEIKPSKRKTKKLKSSGKNANKTSDSDENPALAKEKNDLLGGIDFLNSIILDTNLKEPNKKDIGFSFAVVSSLSGSLIVKWTALRATASPLSIPVTCGFVGKQRAMTPVREAAEEIENARKADAHRHSSNNS
ncbi:hypothetical protein TNCV_2157741 [Trichonephila clavipes]|nr:hypothetical protein TNCV_2157741 [Trichonephila clavipes]